MRVATEGDIGGRLYQRLGDLRVHVYPETPDIEWSKERADDELRDEAASLGADAVIHVKYAKRTPTSMGARRVAPGGGTVVAVRGARK